MSIIFTRELRISNIFLRKLRFCIAILSFISGIILTSWYGYVMHLEANSSPTLSLPAICDIIIIIVIFLTYTYAVRSKTSFVHKYPRAFVLLGIAAIWLCITIGRFDVRFKIKSSYISDPSDISDSASGMDRAIEAFSVLCGVLILLEVAFTLKRRPFEQESSESLGPQQQKVVIVNPSQPIQPQYPQPYQDQNSLQLLYPMIQQQHHLQEQQFQPKIEMENQYQPTFEIQDQLYNADQQQQQQPMQTHQSFYKPLPRQPQQYYQQPTPPLPPTIPAHSRPSPVAGSPQVILHNPQYRE